MCFCFSYISHLHGCQRPPGVVLGVDGLLDDDDDVAPDVPVLQTVDELGLLLQTAVGPHLGTEAVDILAAAVTPHLGGDAPDNRQHVSHVRTLDKPAAISKTLFSINDR